MGRKLKKEMIAQDQIKIGDRVKLLKPNAASLKEGKRIAWDPVGDDGVFEVVEVVGSRLGDPKNGDNDHRPFLRCRRFVARASLHPDDPESWDVWGWLDRKEN